MIAIPINFPLELDLLLSKIIIMSNSKNIPREQNLEKKITKSIKNSQPKGQLLYILFFLLFPYSVIKISRILA